MKKEGIIINITGGSCDECHVIKDVVYIVAEGVQLCTDCYIRRNRPTIHFTARTGQSFLWSRELQTMESITLTTLEGCGWFLRYHTIDKSRDTTVQLFTLEYFGNKACPRCEGIQFSKRAPVCQNYLCRSSVEQKGRQEAWYD